jgi:hypothetical protein
MRSHRLGVVSSIGPDGAPQSALVGIATTTEFDVVFDTVSDSRKHANLMRDPRASLVLSGPGEQTLQLEGIGRGVSVSAAADARWRGIYYDVWPDGRDRLRWPKLAYWRIAPRWARFSDFARGPLIIEFTWP